MAHHVSLVDVSLAVAHGWAAFVRGAVHGETLALPAGALGIGGEPFEDMNAGYVVAPDGAADAVEQFVARLRARELPGQIQVSSIAEAQAEAVMDGLGLSRSEAISLMCCRATDARRADASFTVRRVTDDAGLLDAARVLGDACELPAVSAERMLGPGFVALDDVELFLAVDADEAIACCGTSRAGDIVGLYGVGSKVAHRGKGAAHAVVAAAMDFHIRAGAHLFGLLSAPAAERLYTDLGFTHVDTVTVWSVGEE